MPDPVFLPAYAVVVAVGPNPHEVPRLIDLAQSIAHHEPGKAILVIVDDGQEPRDLASVAGVPGRLDAVSMPNRRAIAGRTFTRGKGICSAIMTGLSWAQAHTDAEFVLKLDTDSLVVAPFRERIATRLRADRNVAMIGAYRSSPGGGPRNFDVHRVPIAELGRRFSWQRFLRPGTGPSAASGRHVRTLLRAARANGYVTGEHCLGGGYAVTRSFLDTIAQRGLLADPSIWSDIDLPEDVMIGIHVRAIGAGFADDVGEGGVFGVRHMGLAFPPAELSRRGYAIIHSVKNDPDFSEEDIRAWFEERRRDGQEPGQS